MVVLFYVNVWLYQHILLLVEGCGGEKKEQLSCSIIIVVEETNFLWVRRCSVRIYL
jgi:hypothetical protein